MLKIDMWFHLALGTSLSETTEWLSDDWVTAHICMVNMKLIGPLTVNGLWETGSASLKKMLGTPKDLEAVSMIF